MRTAALLLALLLPAAAAAALKKPSKPARKHMPNAARRLYERVAQEGRRVNGMMLEDAELPPQLKYFEHSDRTGPRIVVAEDRSWCVTAFMVKMSAGMAAIPGRAIDRGCTGDLSTIQLDWEGNAPTPMSQGRLDSLYAQTYAHAFPE